MYLLEGNMGAGKSTLLALVKQHLAHLSVVTEPVDCWHKSDQGSSLLGHFYQDQQRWSYTMEKFTLITRVREYLKESRQSTTHKIMERSIYSGYYCFAKNGYLQGTMTEAEWSAYNLWFEFLVKESCKTPTGFIYLYTTPDVCFERMHKRKRSGEEIVPLSYLQELHDAHEMFLIHKNGTLAELTNVPVLRLDVCKEFVNDPQETTRILNEISSFIAQTNQETICAQPLYKNAESAYFKAL